MTINALLCDEDSGGQQSNSTKIIVFTRKQTEMLDTPFLAGRNITKIRNHSGSPVSINSTSQGLIPATIIFLICIFFNDISI
jgi:hypothetical protein